MNEKNRSGFKELDHTADVSIQIWADSLEGLFLQGLAGLCYVSGVKTDSTDEKRKQKFEVIGFDLESLLISFLEECNFQIQHELRVPIVHELEIKNNHLAGEFTFQKLTALGTEIKAVTYHNLKVEFKENFYTTKIVFDV